VRQDRPVADVVRDFAFVASTATVLGVTDLLRPTLCRFRHALAVVTTLCLFTVP